MRCLKIFLSANVRCSAPNSSKTLAISDNTNSTERIIIILVYILFLINLICFLCSFIIHKWNISSFMFFILSCYLYNKYSKGRHVKNTCCIIPSEKRKIANAKKFGTNAIPNPTAKRQIWQNIWTGFLPILSAILVKMTAPVACPSKIRDWDNSALSAPAHTRSHWKGKLMYRMFPYWIETIKHIVSESLWHCKLNLRVLSLKI